MKLAHFYQLNKEQQKAELFKCCGSAAWVNAISEKMPINSIDELKSTSDAIWALLEKSDFLEAFSHHPKIGDVESLQKKFAATSNWAAGEQAAVNEAALDVLTNLKIGNDLYEARFGYIFIVCATGKTAAEMLQLLDKRLQNEPEVELKISAAEQNKITHIRIDKLFS
jgi:2-oxo-4-hydroxy-4-carboxy-5-ureidoimidazoline decarboxylase